MKFKSKELRKSELEEEEGRNAKRTRRARMFTRERLRQRSLIPRLEKIEVEYMSNYALIRC